MNIADVKKELSGDEKVLESVFKLETIYKKYKFIIWALVIGVILFFVGRSIMQEMHNTKLTEANEAFLTLQNKADDTQALAILKEKNPALFELFTFAQASKNEDTKALASLSKSTNSIVSDASKYTIAALEKKQVDSKLYSDMAILESAYLALQSGNTKEAKVKLGTIAKDSPLSMIASLLKHSMLKDK